MADLRMAANPLFLREEELRDGVDLLLLAYRDFAAAADETLARFGLGRAHLRAVHALAREPGITVGALAHRLRVSKQSLNRVLADLLDRRLVDQAPGQADRRQRRLTLTATGQELERELSIPLRGRLAGAYREAGAEAVAGFRRVLSGMLDEEERRRFERPPNFP